MTGGPDGAEGPDGPDGPDGAGGDRAAEVVRLLGDAGDTLGIAESVTGGALVAAVVDVPGASAVLRGAVVAYATDLKSSVLGVPVDLLRAHGAVHPEVAAAMAAGAARVLGCTWGLATTGVAGPGEQDAHPVGTVHVAVSGPVERVRSLHLPGGRPEVRAAAVRAALELLLGCARSVPAHG